MISSEKQLYKKFAGEDGGSPNTLEALSPPQNGYGCYSVSPGYSRSRSFSRSSGSEDESSATLCDAIDRKTLFHLISTMNAAFPDYDFSTAKSEEFTKEPNLQVRNHYISNFTSSFSHRLIVKLYHSVSLEKHIFVVSMKKTANF